MVYSSGPVTPWMCMEMARQNGKLRAKQPRLKAAQDREIRLMHDSGDYNVAEIAALFSVSRPTVCRALQRTAALPGSRATLGPRPTSLRACLGTSCSAR